MASGRCAVQAVTSTSRQSTMLGLRRFWSQSIRLTCRTWISQRSCRAHQAMAAPARQKSRSVHAKLADQEIRAHHADRALIGWRTSRHSRSCGQCGISAPATRRSRCAGGRCGPPCAGGRRTTSRSRAADRRRPACPAPSRCIRARTSPAIRRKPSWSSRRASLFHQHRGTDRARPHRGSRDSSRCQSAKLVTSSW